MTDDLTAFRQARREFEQRLVAVTPAQMSLPTPCSEWDVAALIRHVIDGDTFAAIIIDGASLHDAITALMGMDDTRDFAVEADALDAAFAAASPEQIVDHPVGPTPVHRFLEYRTTDYAAHAWDLARATGQDESLDPDLVARLWDASEARLESLTGSDQFGGGPSGVDLPADAPRQARWLDRLGRRGTISAG